MKHDLRFTRRNPLRSARIPAALLVGALLFGSVACQKPIPHDPTIEETSPMTTIQPAGTDASTSPVTDAPIGSETAVTPETETIPPAPTPLSPDELSDRLASSIYADAVAVEGFAGLADPSDVGIHAAAFNEAKYPAPPDDDCAHIYRVTDYGITPEGTENAAKFNALMQELVSVDGIKKVVFPAGVYPFEGTLRIEGVDDLSICSDRADSLFEVRMTAWCQGISIRDCCNLHLNDFAYDYATPTAVTGTIVSSGGSTVTIRIDEEYDLTDPRYNGGKITYGSYMEFVLDETTGKYIPDRDGNLFYNSTGDQIRNITDGTYDPATRELTLTFRSIQGVKTGTRVNVAYTMYEYFGMYAADCENLYVENAHFYHTAGMTFGANDTENIYLNRFRLSPREGSGRLMTATADGLHFGSCRGEVVLTNSVLEYSHDDCLNIKGAYAAVQSGIGHTITASTSPDLRVEVGDVLDVYEINTFRYVGGYTVTAVDSGTYTVKETVTEPLADGYMLCNASKSPAFTAQNCFFGNKRNRGMLIQCRGVKIANCTFQNIVHGAIQILSVADIFAEGIMPRDVMVENNKFLNNAIEDVHIFTWGRDGTTSGTITNVTVRNNFFHATGTYPVDILGGGACTVSGNLFHDHAVRSAVIIRTSEGIAVTSNLSIPRRKNGYKTVNQDATDKDITVSGNYIGDEAEE